jgi:hypothetical protein
MGWTGSQKFDSLPTKDWLAKEFTNESDTHKWELTDVSMRGNTAYGIHKVQDKATGIILAEALIILTRKENDWIYFKEMGETVHPYYYDAPKKLLDKLDALFPPFNDNAKAWRDACRAKATKTKSAKLVIGDVVKFAKEMSFGQFSEDTFTYESYFGKDAFRATNGVLCRITKWKQRDFTVVSTKGESNE